MRARSSHLIRRVLLTAIFVATARFVHGQHSATWVYGDVPSAAECNAASANGCESQCASFGGCSWYSYSWYPPGGPLAYTCGWGGECNS